MQAGDRAALLAQGDFTLPLSGKAAIFTKIMVMEQVLAQYNVKVLTITTEIGKNYILLQIKIKLGAVKLVDQPNVWQVQRTYSQTASSCLINSTDKGGNY